MAFKEMLFEMALRAVLDKLEAFVLGLGGDSRLLYDATGMMPGEAATMFLEEVHKRPALESLFDGTAWVAIQALAEDRTRVKKASEVPAPALPPGDSESSTVQPTPPPNGG